MGVNHGATAISKWSNGIGTILPTQQGLKNTACPVMVTHPQDAYLALATLPGGRSSETGSSSIAVQVDSLSSTET